MKTGSAGPEIETEIKFSQEEWKFFGNWIIPVTVLGAW
jgi:hypothetical protein